MGVFIKKEFFMAKYECTIYDNFYNVRETIERGVLDSSMTASLEEESDFYYGDIRCSVRAFERYSAFGGNRLSLTVTFVGNDESVKVVAVTSGGSEAVFFKLNTLGEESFLNVFIDVLEESGFEMVSSI